MCYIQYILKSIFMVASPRFRTNEANKKSSTSQFPSELSAILYFPYSLLPWYISKQYVRSRLFSREYLRLGEIEITDKGATEMRRGLIGGQDCGWYSHFCYDGRRLGNVVDRVPVRVAFRTTETTSLNWRHEFSTCPARKAHCLFSRKWMRNK